MACVFPGSACHATSSTRGQIRGSVNWAAVLAHLRQIVLLDDWTAWSTQAPDGLGVDRESVRSVLIERRIGGLGRQWQDMAEAVHEVISNSLFSSGGKESMKADGDGSS
jgi:hypothetical protein